MTGKTKREIMKKLLELEVKYLQMLQKGEIPKERPYAVLADEYGCTENKIAVIKCYYKKGGIEALVDDKERGGFRFGSGRPKDTTRKWHAQRGEIKEGNRWIKSSASNK